jgi:hypothetical protein
MVIEAVPESICYDLALDAEVAYERSMGPTHDLEVDPAKAGLIQPRNDRAPRDIFFSKGCLSFAISGG